MDDNLKKNMLDRANEIAEEIDYYSPYSTSEAVCELLDIIRDLTK